MSNDDDDDDDDGCNAHDDGYSIAYYRTLSLTYLVSLLTIVAAVNILAPIDFVGKKTEWQLVAVFCCCCM
jgi:hypothetical protein